MLKCVIKDEDKLTPKDNDQLEKLLIPLFSWSYHFTQSFKNSHTLYYGTKPKWRLLLYDGKELIGSISIVERKISSPFPLVIGGLGNLGIKELYQGKNLSFLIFEKVHEFMKEKCIDISLLFCIERLKGLYVKIGYIQIDKPVIFHQEGKTEEECLALFHPLLVSPEQAKQIKQKGLDIGEESW